MLHFLLQMSGSISRMMYGPLRSGVDVLIQDTMTLHVPASACTSPILVLSLTPGVHISHRDAVPENQVMFLDISDKLVRRYCTTNLQEYSASNGRASCQNRSVADRRALGRQLAWQLLAECSWGLVV